MPEPPAGKIRTVLVCGDRDFADRKRVFETLDRLLADEGDFRIVHGGESGAETLAAQWAVAHRVQAIAERASWFKYGRAAGPLRNEHMLNFYEPFLVVAFPVGRDTVDLLGRARRAGVGVMQIDALG